MSANSSQPPKPLIDREQLEQRIAAMAAEIEADFGDSDEPLVCLGILKGSVFFLVDLLKQINLPLSVDFFRISSYEGTSAGEVRLLKDVDLPLKDQNVLIIEDIVDTGNTLRVILDLMEFRGANTVKLCTLLDKPSRREVEVPIDYCGFQIEDHFVVGFGLDYNERYRNLPYIGILEAED